MMAIGIKVCDMALESKRGLMERSTKVSILMVISMDTENRLGQVVAATKVSGRLAA